MSSFMTAEDARELEKTKGAEMRTAENGLILQIQAAAKIAIRQKFPFLLWELPMFVTGAPQYDLDDMLDTLAAHFKQHGWGVTADHHHLTLFITWKSIRPSSQDLRSQPQSRQEEKRPPPIKRKEPEREPATQSSSSSNEPAQQRRRHPEANINSKNSPNPHWTKMRFHQEDDLF
jgi:hypothetical protein